MLYGQRIRELRKEKKVSQIDLAKKAGVSQGAISFYERDENVPSSDILQKICVALGISVAEFLAETPTRVYKDGTIEPLPPDDEKKEALLDKVISDVQDLEYDGLVAVDALIRGLLNK